MTVDNVRIKRSSETGKCARTADSVGGQYDRQHGLAVEPLVECCATPNENTTQKQKRGIKSHAPRPDNQSRPLLPPEPALAPCFCSFLFGMAVHTTAHCAHISFLYLARSPNQLAEASTALHNSSPTSPSPPTPLTHFGFTSRRPYVERCRSASFI